jgi:CubicO group peptidase (beta-lactamase class C family)
MMTVPKLLTRSAFLRAIAGTIVAGATAGSLNSSCAAQRETTSSPAAPGDDSDADIDSLLGELEAKVEAGMQEYGIPGVALGLLHQGTDYIRGYGVTNVDSPQQVDGGTLFRIGSTTKTFTGTAVMRLVEQGKLDLDATVQNYLPDFVTSDPSVAPRVTLRQLLNHSPGWLGDYYESTGRGDDALAKYVAEIARLPQLTPLGEVFAYNNAAIDLAGRLIEVVTGSTYEEAVRELVLDPLGLSHTRFFTDEIVGFKVAASHNIADDGEPVVDTSFWEIPRSLHPTGGLISSVRDQLRYASFHLGDGRAPDGTRLLTSESLVAMRSDPGPGGTLVVELDGMGVTWMLRPSAEGVRIVQHGGNWQGQNSGFIMVPERGFALTVLTNSDGGPKLLAQLFADDWALRRFAGVSNLPAEPRTLTQAELAPYEGRYISLAIDKTGAVMETEWEIKADNGRLHVTERVTERESIDVPIPGDPTDVAETEDTPTVETRLAFYRDDYALVYDDSGEPTFSRVNFLRGADGGVACVRSGGRLYRHQGVSGGLPETGGPDSVGDLLGQLIRRLL